MLSPYIQSTICAQNWCLCQLTCHRKPLAVRLFWHFAFEFLLIILNSSSLLVNKISLYLSLYLNSIHLCVFGVFSNGKKQGVGRRQLWFTWKIFTLLKFHICFRLLFLFLFSYEITTFWNGEQNRCIIFCVPLHDGFAFAF